MSGARKTAAPVLMALSGAAALAYETVWLRELSRAFGVTVHAVAGLVALYMGGLALGAALAARRRGAADWLRVYAWLELGAGLCSLATTRWLLRLPETVAALSPASPLPTAARLALAAPALLPPTMLLGATLPVLARDGADAAVLYGTNTLGALVGLLAAAFVTIGTWGETATIGAAAAANALAAAAAFALSRRTAVKTAGPAPTRGAGAPRLALGLFAASGFCALGCEVLWSRELIPLLGNSTYAFALLLAAYLAGLGVGSCLKIETPRPWETLATLLAALGAAIALSAESARFIGLRLDAPEFLYSPLRRWADFPLVAAEALVFVFPTALVLGLLFPVALRLSGDDGGKVGRLYAWNTLGGIAGSLLCGFAGISLLGTHGSLLALAALAVAAGLAAAWRARTRAAWAAAGTLALLAAVAAAASSPDPTLEIMRRRLINGRAEDVKVLFHDESPAATITGTAIGDHRILFINGIMTSGKGVFGEMMAAIPDLMIADPRRALVICFGGGNTFRTSSLIGNSVDAVELIADVPRRMPFFHEDAAQFLDDPKNAVYIEDGRNYLLRSPKRYDIIVVDATPPLYSAGAVNLYTREFFDLARRRLSDDGVMTLWLPTLSFESDYWHILSAFDGAFEHVAVWHAPGYSGFLVFGSPRPIERSPKLMARRLRERLRGGLPSWAQGPDPAYLRPALWLDEGAVRAYAGRYAPLTDDRPTVEFPLARFWRGERLEPNTNFLDKAVSTGAGDAGGALGGRAREMP
jgi:predicted membrane-bound spermidine synthase